MILSSLMHRRRYSLGKVFWVTLAIYLFFVIVGLIAIYVSPALNTATNWKKTFSWYKAADHAFVVAFFTLFYFVTLNMFHRLFAGKHKVVQFIQPVVLSFVLVGLYTFISLKFFADPNFEVSVNEAKLQHQNLTVGLMLFIFILSAIFITGFAMLLAYLTYLRDEKKQRKILEEQKMQLEVEKSQANLNFLKAQINPHFLHNTLNFLYAKSLPYSSELSEGILTLSDIMRYALGPASKDGKVPLRDEIEHVRNVIKINQLRFSNNLNVKFDVNGVVNGATTIPFILITIVENAFKHGDLKSQEHPIDIQLNIDGKTFRFYCHNKKKSGPKEISTGIGLDNIKKQLDLTYGRNYVLDVKDDAEFYTTQLTVKAA